MPLVLNIWFYFSPIVYPAETFPEQYRWLMWANPPGMAIQYLRTAVVDHQSPDLQGVAALFGIGVVLAFLGYALFQRMQRRFAEIL